MMLTRISRTGLFFLFALLWHMAASAKDVIHSSVSPEFVDGLHAKYLNYLAQKTGLDLKVFPMPFARRLTSLEQGKIDIMVGVKSQHKANENFVFLKPSYDSARWVYFIKAENAQRFTKASDTKSLILGITIDEKKIQKITERNYKRLVSVTNLSQKIHLLEKNRIDIFTHFEGSGLNMITELGFEEKIILAPFQYEERRDYYFVLSTKSPLLKYKDRFEKVIADAVNSGDFENINRAHYQEL